MSHPTPAYLGHTILRAQGVRYKGYSVCVVSGVFALAISESCLPNKSDGLFCLLKFSQSLASVNNNKDSYKNQEHFIEMVRTKKS